MKVTKVLFALCLVSSRWIAWAEPVRTPGAEKSKCYEAGTLVKEGAKRADGSTAEEQFYRQALERCPGMAEAGFNLALNLSKQKRYDESRKAFETSLAQRDDPMFRTALASMLLESGNGEGAEREFQGVLQRDPANIGALQGLSVVYSRRKEFAKAREILLRAQQADPKNTLTLFNLAAIWQQEGNTTEALSHYRQLIEVDPKHPEGLLQAGALSLEIGEIAEADKYLRSAVLVDERSAQSHRFLGLAQLKLGDPEKAEVSLGKARSLGAVDADTVAYLGITMIRNKRASQARELLKPVVPTGNSALAWSVLGWAEMELGLPADAETSLRQALTLDGSLAEARNNLGVVLQQQGKTEDAKREFAQAAALDPTLVEARKNSALLGK